MRKKPIIVKARPFMGGEDPDVIKTSIMNGGSITEGYVIVTLEGPVQIKPGDWIIEGIRGEKYPINHGILLETYSFVDEKDK